MRTTRRYLQEMIKRYLINEEIKIGVDLKNKIDDYMKKGKKYVIEYVNDPRYKKRIQDEIGMSDEEAGKFISQIVQKTIEAEYAILAQPGKQKDYHFTDYRRNAYLEFNAIKGDYKHRLTLIPVVSLPVEVITHSAMDDQLLEVLIQHELLHIETLMKGDKETPKGSVPFKNKIKEIIINDPRVVKKERFDNADQYANFIIMYGKISGDQEVQDRLAQLRKRVGDNEVAIKKAINYSRDNSFGKVIDEYGQMVAQLLFLLDPDLDIEVLFNKVDRIAIAGDDKPQIV